MKSFKKLFKGILIQMLALERINTQRCLGKDMDMTKTIIDGK